MIDLTIAQRKRVRIAEEMCKFPSVILLDGLVGDEGLNNLELIEILERDFTHATLLEIAKKADKENEKKAEYAHQHAVEHKELNNTKGGYVVPKHGAISEHEKLEEQL